MRQPRLATVLLAVLVAACGGGPVVTLTPSTTEPPHGGPSGATLGPRPSSLATIEIAEPAQGATVAGSSAHVVIKLTGASMVTETTTTVRPDEGHVHLYLNNQIVSMHYGLEQDIPVEQGTLVLKAEFVAADHAPFSPPVWSTEIVFTVR